MFDVDTDYSAHREMVLQCEAEAAEAAYFNQVITVVCNAPCCAMVTRGTRDELERRFWQIGAYSAFCPNCAGRKLFKRAA